MEHESQTPLFSPFKITVVYLLFGSMYILVSDHLTFALVTAPGLQKQLQTFKGLGFVIASSGLILALTRHLQVQLQDANEELAESVQHLHILHRILRHNVRNKCNIIDGHAELVQTDGGTDSVGTIKQQAAELVTLSEKSKVLRDVRLSNNSLPEFDLVDEVNAVTAALKEKYPDVVLSTELPETATVRAHPRIQEAIYELAENALTHADDPLFIQVRTDIEVGGITLTVEDQGSGLPVMEQEVLAEGFIETPTQHSVGIGLWVVRYLVAESGGTLSVTSGDNGTEVQITLPTSRDESLPEPVQSIFE